jgi:hypothetical protein
MSKSKTTSGGISLAGLIFIVFLVLKLAEVGVVAKWSWWAVTSPLWIPILAAIALYVFIIIFSITKIARRESKSSKAIEKTPVIKSNFQKRLEEMAEQRKNKFKDGSRN